MRISGTTGTVLALVALAALGGGTYFFRTVQENRRLELQARTQQDRLKTKEAEAARDEKLAATRIAEAALAKSANERKAAEATAAAEHDRKLRLYSRASLSRAETVALQRAERRLALEEAGLLAPEDNAGDGGMAPAEEAAGNTAGAAADGNAPTNAVVAVTWPEARPDATPAGVKVAEIQRKIDDTHRAAQNRAARRRIADFGRRIDQAVSEGRLADAAHERRALVSLVPDYVDVYIGLLDEARAANDEAAQKKRLDELVALVPDWRRVAVLVRLIQHDEAFYSRALAGRVEKDDYVKAFRKIYDAARRDKGDRDERDEKVAHICRVLATYVPDFERSPEWK